MPPRPSSASRDTNPRIRAAPLASVAPSYSPMKKNPSSGTVYSRRTFVQRTAIAAAISPLIVPSRLFGADAPSNRIRVGHIGCGRIAQGHDMPGGAASGLAEVAAVCDLDTRRVASGKAHVEKLYQGLNRPQPKIDLNGDYPELLARKDIDAGVISKPDHWHAPLAMAP